MPKNKVKHSSKQTTKNKFLQIGVVVVIIFFVVYFIFSNFLIDKKPSGNELDKVMKGKITYTFQKDGELFFTKHEGEQISRIDIEIAEDDLKREIGLMMRRNMAENQGMLFIFPIETFQSFWMKNTILPLDIIYVNSQMEIVKIHKNTTPYSEQSYPSGKLSQFVVEVNAGYTDKYGIKEGDKIAFRRN